MRRAAAAGLAVFVAGWIWISALGTGPLERTEFELCPPFGETGSYELRTNWWPPAQTRCEVSRPTGATSVRWTTPWDAWALVVAFAAAAAALWSRQRMFVRLPLAAGFALAGLVVFFLW